MLSARLWWLWFAIAYGAGIAARLSVHWRSEGRLARAPDGHRVLTATDGYYYATGVLRTLRGVLEDYERVPTAWDNVLVASASAFGALTSVHPSDIAYFYPVVMAPLVVTTVFAWSHALELPRLALLAALPVAVGYSYLNRTSPGQFDTDLFAVAVPYLALAAAVGSLSKQRPRLATCAGMLFALARYAHPGAERVLLVCSGGVLVYALWSHRNRHGAQLLLALAVGLSPLPVPVRVALVLVLHCVWPRLVLRDVVLFRAGFIALVAMQLVQLASLEWAILRLSNSALDSLRFYDVRREVSELRPISLSVMAERVSGGGSLLVLSLLGFVGLVISRPAALVLLPLLALGTWLAHVRGLRFTIYAVPVAALGLAWLASRALDLVGSLARARWPRLGATLLVLGVSAYPAAQHAATFVTSGSYSVGELGLMGELKKHARPGDYAVAWWDHAYGLWYYAHVRTLVDGMKQDEDLFVVAEVLYGEDQRASARLARLAVEELEQQRGRGSAIRALFAQARERGVSPELFLQGLSRSPWQARERSREIFAYLPWKVARMARSWARARRVEGIESRGEEAVGYLEVNPAFIVSGAAGSRGMHGPPSRSGLASGVQQVPRDLASTIEVRGRRDGTTSLRTVQHNPQGRLHAIQLIGRGATVLVDDVMLRSNYVRLALLDITAPQAFAPAAITAGGHIFRVVP